MISTTRNKERKKRKIWKKHKHRQIVVKGSEGWSKRGTNVKSSKDKGTTYLLLEKKYRNIEIHKKTTSCRIFPKISCGKIKRKEERGKIRTNQYVSFEDLE